MEKEMLKYILVLAVIITVIFSISCSNGSSTEPEEENLKLMFSPAEQTVPLDTEAEYSILVENADNLFAFSTEIVFNSDITELLQDAVSIGSFWNADLVELSMLEEDRLSITISMQQTSGEDGMNGDGELFSFSLTGLTLGESDLTFENLLMIDDDGNEVSNFNDIELTNGKLTVE